MESSANMEQCLGSVAEIQWCGGTYVCDKELVPGSSR